MLKILPWFGRIYHILYLLASVIDAQGRPVLGMSPVLAIARVRKGSFGQ